MIYLVLRGVPLNSHWTKTQVFKVCLRTSTKGQGPKLGSLLVQKKQIIQQQ